MLTAYYATTIIIIIDDGAQEGLHDMHGMNDHYIRRICTKLRLNNEALSAEDSKRIMGKRSKELRKRKREQAQRLASSALVSDTNGIYCQPLINVLLSVKAPQSTGTAFYHDALKGFRKSLRGLLDNMAKTYEAKSPTTKKQRKEQMKRYNARRDQAEHATVDVQEDAADLVAQFL